MRGLELQPLHFWKHFLMQDTFEKPDSKLASKTLSATRAFCFSPKAYPWIWSLMVLLRL